MPIHDWSRVDHGTFHDFHQAWLGTIRTALNANLPHDYYAMIEQHTPEGIPDVLALQVGGTPPNGNAVPSGNGNGTPSNGSAGGGTATAVLPAPPGLATLLAATPHVWFTSEVAVDVYAKLRRTITIRRADGDRVVAIVEIVSPGNKSSRDGLRAFTEKMIAAIRHGIHVLIIDLFPPGPRDPNGVHPHIWSAFLDEDGYTQPSDKPLTLASYSAGAINRAFVQPVAVGQTWPDFPLFLEPEAYLNAPLESSYAAAWDGTSWRVKEKLT